MKIKQSLSSSVLMNSPKSEQEWTFKNVKTNKKPFDTAS